MTVSAPTVFVPSDSDGMYKAPENRPVDRIGAILRARLMPVDQNGFDRPRATPDPSVTAVVAPLAPTPSMADALAAACLAVGGDLTQLLDSQAFVTAIMPVSPSDQDGLQSVIAAHMPAPTGPGMRPNPAQGAPSAIAPGPVTGSVLDQIRAQVSAKALDQPVPPGSTTL